MATKINGTPKSSPKTAKSTAAVATPKNKNTSKTNNSDTTATKPKTVKLPKEATAASKVQPVSSPTEHKQKSKPSNTEKSAKETSPLINAGGEQSTPQVSSIAVPANKWLEIRSILEKLKEDTLREIKKSVKNGTEAVAVIEPGGDIYDQASSERDRELGLLLGDREREKIHSIDEALLRIDEGEYGICEECDEDIPLGRLKAMPFTRHCVKCKSDLEKLQAQTKRVEEERAYREIPLGADDEES